MKNKKIETEDVKGLVFGDLEVLEVFRTHNSELKAKCRCLVCGRVNEYWYRNIKRGVGVNHYMCASRIPKDKIFYKLRNTHSKMKDRCDNPKNHRYKHYGARGIWHEFEHFIDFYDYAKPLLLKAMEEVDSDMYKLSLDRIDNNKGYIKGNLRFANRKTQILNSSKILNRIVTFTDKITEEKTVFKGKSNQEIADAIGWTLQQVHNRIGEKKYKNLVITVERCND